jgi:hypothetical protein
MLERLREKECLEAWYANPTAERGGRRRRYYKVLGLGERALKESGRDKQSSPICDEAWGSTG